MHFLKFVFIAFSQTRTKKNIFKELLTEEIETISCKPASTGWGTNVHVEDISGRNL